MLGHMSAQGKICSDISRNDQMLIEICNVALYFVPDICLGFGQVNSKSARKMSNV